MVLLLIDSETFLPIHLKRMNVILRSAAHTWWKYLVLEGRRKEGRKIPRTRRSREVTARPATDNAIIISRLTVKVSSSSAGRSSRRYGRSEWTFETITRVFALRTCISSTAPRWNRSSPSAWLRSFARYSCAIGLKNDFILRSERCGSANNAPIHSRSSSSSGMYVYERAHLKVEWSKVAYLKVKMERLKA